MRKWSSGYKYSKIKNWIVKYIRINKETNKNLEAHSKKTKKTFGAIIIEALEKYFNK